MYLEKNPMVKSDFPALVHQFEENFDARRKIDEAWNEVLGWGYDDESLDEYIAR